MAAMPYAPVDGIELCYDTLGDPADPTILLVRGIGGQMIEWQDEFCQAIADRGFHVVRYDNRDVGLSTHLEEPVDDVFALLAAMEDGQPVTVPYLLSDMAADAVGLLDHLGVARAHVVGMSMGGMIGQVMAIEHPSRLLSLTSMMSTTGDPDVGLPTAEAIQALWAPPAKTRQEAQDGKVAHAHVWGSPGMFDEDELRRMAGELWDRDHDPSGTPRQLAAILASGSRSEALRTIDIPTLVIHGTADTLVAPSGGERTAEVVPDAKLLLIEGMGHDLPRPLWPRLVDAICSHAAQHSG